jgi:stage V sporulation protein S
MRLQPDDADQNELPPENDEEHKVHSQAFAHEPQREGPPINVVKVSAVSRPSAVAGAIAGECRRFGTVEVQAVGASALNQAIKAIVLARAFLRDDGIEICCVPSFTSVMFSGQRRTGVQLTIAMHNPKASP